MDVTTVNKKVRNYLDSLGVDMVDLKEPMWDGKYWHVLVTFDDQVRGTVFLDPDQGILEQLSYPQKGLTNLP